MLRVINASDTLKQAAFEFRHGVTEVVVGQAHGRRRSTTAAPAWWHVIFSATIVAACGDLVADTDTVRLGPMIMVHRLNEAFAHVAWMSRDLVRPPAGADHEHGVWLSDVQSKV